MLYYCKMKNICFLVSSFWIVLTSCSPIQKSISELENKYQYHAGFYLYDPIAKKELESIKADRYFTAASNTKVYTLYASNLILSDSIPAFRYIETDTALIVWGLCDPSFLNNKLPQGNAYSFLARQSKIYISNSNSVAPRFGSGWSWDDYNGGYSQEQTSFPIYGNSVYFNRDSISKELIIRPSIFKDSVHLNMGDKYQVTREEFGNKFEWDTISNCTDCERLRPIYFGGETVNRLLSDTLNLPVYTRNISLVNSAKTFYSIPVDSVFKVMMQESDNFMAEHLLLSVAAELSDTLSTQIAIKEMNQRTASFMPDKLVWKDGSGLSRYNLVTPRNTVALWQQLYKDMGEERLFSLISVGGKAGTLEKWFNADTPYIYGKTGTLSNNFSLSGFLIAKSGKRLVFSYMNNNYPVSSSAIKKEMEVILRKVYEKY